MRNIFEINSQWRFFLTDNTQDEPVWMPEKSEEVTLPHVWNKDDQGKRGCAVYQHSLNWVSQPDKKVFLDFGAVAGVCKAWVNGSLVGEHRGGYSRFRFEISSCLQHGENRLTVTADNSRYEDVNPLTGDFTVYGGIYRDVSLIVTEKSHFDLLYYGSLGLDIKPDCNGTVELFSRTVGSAKIVEYTIFDKENVVATLCAPANEKVKVCVENPHLWNGTLDPFLYRCKAVLLENKTPLDEVVLSFGFRDIQMTPEHGLFLNNTLTKINGVAKHQDFEGCGNAPTKQNLDKDMALIREIGANSVRLSHYQHPDYFYDLCDENGMLVWAEIPMLMMPDGNEGVVENAKSQLTELILQQKHHPSIYCWGIQNEIAMMGESIEMYRKTQELNDLVQKLDPTRISASANLYDVKNNSQLNYISQMVGYNVYFGWYYQTMEDYKTFLDDFHRDNPQIPFGVSEYGVDCSVNFHSETPKAKDYTEEFQSLFHETVYPVICAREWMWGSYVWNMFDFGSAIREEGGCKGKNCKGLVSYDRLTRKDAFYFYKACWNPQPIVYLAGKRFAKRSSAKTTVKVYSNQPEVTLEVNGSVFDTKKGRHCFVFENVPLQDGENTIQATAGTLTDSMIITKIAQPESSYIFIDPNPEINVKNWFIKGESQDDLFPEGRFSIMDSMNDLKASPKAWSLLEQEVPNITGDARNAAGSPMSLLNIFNWKRKDYSEEFVQGINRKLNQIKK